MPLWICLATFFSSSPFTITSILIMRPSYLGIIRLDASLTISIVTLVS